MNDFNNKHKFKKIFNKNTVKISYSCMPSMKTIINSHNRKVLSSAETRNEKTCNCTVKGNWPLQGNCLTANNLYKATLSSPIPGYGTKMYLGTCEPPFKSRFNSHNATFKNKKYETSPKFAGEVWKIKEQNGQYNIKWSIVKHFPI